MIRWAAVALIAASMMIGIGACGKKRESAVIKIRMTNDTGADMNGFTLDYGDGTVEYQIFTNDYTFSADAKITGSQSMAVSYVADGQPAELRLDETLELDMHGGTMVVLFLRNEKTSLSFQPAK